MPYYQLSCACNCARREVLRAGTIPSVLRDMHGLAWQPLILGHFDSTTGPFSPFLACNKDVELRLTTAADPISARTEE